MLLIQSKLEASKRSFQLKKYNFIYISLLSIVALSGCQNKSDAEKSLSSHKYVQDQVVEINESDKPDSSQFTIKSESHLFPSNSNPIIISFYLKYLEPPPLDKRQKLISNYDAVNQPLAGWSLAMTRLRTSLRMELYLKDSDGVGGWYTLAPIPVTNTAEDKNRWYAVSIIVAPGEFISSIYSRVNPDFTPDKDEQSDITGVTLEAFGQIESDSVFKVTSGASKNSSLRIDIEELAIFKLEQIPDKTEFLIAAKGGTRRLKELFKSNCSLAIGGAGEDFCKIYSNNDS